MSSEHNNNIYKRLPENKTSTIIVLFSDSLNIIHLSILSTVVFLPEFVFLTLSNYPYIFYILQNHIGGKSLSRYSIEQVSYLYINYIIEKIRVWFWRKMLELLDNIRQICWTILVLPQYGRTVTLQSESTSSVYRINGKLCRS